MGNLVPVKITSSIGTISDNLDTVEASIMAKVEEYKKEDIKTVQIGMNEYEKEIVCPNCQETIRVEER